MIHALKTEPEFFEAVASGSKTFEVRALDRPYEVGDFLALNEWSDDGYTGRCMMVAVSYILKDFELIKTGTAVMSIIPCAIMVVGNGFERGYDSDLTRVRMYERGKCVPQEVRKR